MPSMRQHGLTLIEMLVAISLLAVVLTTAIPAFGRFMVQQQLTASANALVGHLQYARNEAVIRRTRVAACPSLDGRNCSGTNRWDEGWIVYLDPDNSGEPESPGHILRVVEGDPDMRLRSGGRHRVRFTATGMAYGTNLTIRVCRRGNQEFARAVIVSNPGRVRATREVEASECIPD